MARSRNIKPGFCQNEELIELPFETRLLFALLPMFADREGRLEDRPKKIKIQVFPADNLDFDPMLQALHDKEFIRRYSVEGIPYIQIINFTKHQNPHMKEAESTIPAPGEHQTSTRQAQDKHQTSPADSLNLIPDSLNNRSSGDDRFDEFWEVYPRKRKKKAARATWKKIKLDQQADMIIADVGKRSKHDGSWMKGFIPDPTSYLNGELWNDEIIPPRETTNGTDMLPKRDEELAPWAIRHGYREPRPGEEYLQYRQALTEASRKPSP